MYFIYLFRSRQLELDQSAEHSSTERHNSRRADTERAAEDNSLTPQQETQTEQRTGYINTETHLFYIHPYIHNISRTITTIMVKIVNGVIVSDSEHAELMGSSSHNSSSSFGSSGSGADFDLTVNICSYKFNKWMIIGVIFVMTLIMGFKGLLLSCLVFFGTFLLVK